MSTTTIIIGIAIVIIVFVFLFIGVIISSSLSGGGGGSSTSPTITSLTPSTINSSTTTGTAITITGTNFSDIASVFITSSFPSVIGSCTNVVVVNSTTITFVSPAISVSSTSSYNLQVLCNGQGSNLFINGLTVIPTTPTTPTTPTLISINPTELDFPFVGQTDNVTLTGINFSGTTSVTYNAQGTPYSGNFTNVVVFNGTTITATLPYIATPYNIVLSIQVTCNGMASNILPSAFVYLVLGA